MSSNRRLLAGLGLVVLMGVASASAYQTLPEQVAIHFDSTGTPDDYAEKTLGVALVPGLALAVVAMYEVLPRIDPLGENFREFQSYYDLAAVTTVALLAYVHLLVLGWNLGYELRMEQALAPMLAVLGVVFGYVMENARQNWFVGIRTPWTLSDEEVWRKTHQRCGVLFKIAGILALLALPFPDYFEVVAIAPLAAAALLPTVYSYVLYRRVGETNRTGPP